jgi:hypothetical protein
VNAKQNSQCSENLKYQKAFLSFLIYIAVLYQVVTEVLNERMIA